MKPYEESRAPSSTRSSGSFYAKDLAEAREQRRALAEASHVIRAEEQVWEDSPQGRLKHVARPELSANVTDIEAYIQEIPPDGRSGKHRHMAEEFVFVLEGHGYSLHWDVQAEVGETYHWRPDTLAKRFDWEAGDWMYIPVNTIHQHFNDDGDEPARLLCATSMLFKWLGWHDLEQLEDAPRDDP